jgi:hypothetical protein
MPSAEALAASRAHPEVLGAEEVHMRRSIGIARLPVAFASLLLLSNAAGAQLAVSANDGHTAFVNNTTVGSDNPVPDTITILDLSVSPPKVVGEVQAPTSVVGPPQSVAITRDESIALVTASSKLDPANPKRLVPDNKLTVIDLKSSPPAVLATLEAGLGANGVSINRAGTLAEGLGLHRWPIFLADEDHQRGWSWNFVQALRERRARQERADARTAALLV